MYFSNGADTKIYGADFTADYHSDFRNYGNVDWDLSANYNHTEVTRVGLDGNGSPLLNVQTIAFITSDTPQSKIILGGTYHLQGWLTSLHEIRYAKSVAQDTFYSGPDIYSDSVFYESVNKPVRNKVANTVAILRDISTR